MEWKGSKWEYTTKTVHNNNMTQTNDAEVEGTTNSSTHSDELNGNKH